MRLPRLDFPGARHHVMNRGARRAPIFTGPQTQDLFLSILAELPKRFGVRVHGYALMPNHYHLMLESVTGRLPRAMRHLGGEYTRRLNRLNAWDGPVFRGRYHNRLVDTDAYWAHLLIYLHHNPIRAELSDAEACTSHQVYTGAEERPEWLVTEELQGLYGSRAAYEEAYSAVLNGSRSAPDTFDPDRLWAPNTTGTVDVPDFSEPKLSVSEALSEVSRVTGMNVDRVLEKPHGRNGNPANWLAAWWMSRECGIDHGQIALALGLSHSGVSQRVKRVEDRWRTDEQLAAWVRALQTGKRKA